MKITDLESLRREKTRLEALEIAQKKLLQEDVQYFKEEFSFSEIISKTAATLVPQVVRRSAAVNVPVNFVARTFFGKDENIVSTESDKGKGNKIRNIVLGILEGTAAYMVTKAIRKRL